MSVKKSGMTTLKKMSICVIRVDGRVEDVGVVTNGIGRGRESLAQRIRRPSKKRRVHE